MGGTTLSAGPEVRIDVQNKVKHVELFLDWQWNRK